MTQDSNAGIPFPIPPDFPLVDWMKRPSDVAPPVDWDLKSRNEDNCTVETHNRASIRASRHYGLAPDKTGLDVGQKLLPYWLYSTADIQTMVKSTRVCDAVGPLPTYLCLMVEQARVTHLELEEGKKRDREQEHADREKLRAEKEKDKAIPVIGSMVMLNPVVCTPALSSPVVIPDIILLTIFHRLHPPINWFTDEHIQFADQYGHMLASKQIRPIATTSNPAPEKVTVLDVPRMILQWGNDETHSCLSALGWQQATNNFLVALVQLCPPQSNPPVENFADEFRKHRQFFISLKDFEKKLSSLVSFRAGDARADNEQCTLQ
ncbi:hypothetical protein B0H10DRAFT_1951390 [Mycena sp. CBHHK59/15]|nr:hypothetical protein B0H10DRAFT_1951390 [Mycena sp. CBHHK59/15]